MVRVLWVHGLESGPGGYKVTEMQKQGLEVTAPAMAMSLFNPFKANSVVRSLLSPWALFSRWPTQWLPGAIDDSFEACVSIISAAAEVTWGKWPGACDVLVGSSWGGAVAAAVVSQNAWDGPAILMCPALKLREHCGSLHPSLSYSSIVARLKNLPEARKETIILVHGTNDQTVPIQDSVDLSEETGIKLEVVEGGTHGFAKYARDGSLVKRIRQSVQQS